MGKKSYGSVFTAKTKKELKAFKKNGTIVVGFFRFKSDGMYA
jgi:hypothetical protein